MTVWTLVIGSQPTYAFATDDQTTAERHLEDGGLKDDLSYYENDEGSPLWDGEGSLSIRLATPNEHRTWRQAQEHPSVDGIVTPKMQRFARLIWCASTIRQMTMSW